MRMYDIMFEAINERYENGHITFEQAEELNNLAYEKYVIEADDSIKIKGSKRKLDSNAASAIENKIANSKNTMSLADLEEEANNEQPTHPSPQKKRLIKR